MNGRVFEPILGRFLSADPFMPGILGSQAPNRYAYVGNRPQSLVDPSGYFPRNGNALKQWRDGPGQLDALELAINRGWLMWGGVRNVSDGLEGTHVGLLSHSMSVLGPSGTTNGTTLTAANVVWGSGSSGQNFVNGIFAMNAARNAQQSVAGGGNSGEIVVTASRFGSSERISWSPARNSPSGTFAVTPNQWRHATSGQARSFWIDRGANSADPLAGTALGIIDGTSALGLMARSRLENYIADNGLSVTMEQISAELALAHARAVTADMDLAIGIPGLLSPRQVAAYHHSTLGRHGIPASVFGGTVGVPLFLMPFVDGAWSTGHFDATTYSGIWCGGCDSWP